MSRRRRAALGLGLFLVGGLLIWYGASQPSPAERAAAADFIVAGVTTSVEVHDSSLLAARAIADFGIGGEVRLVRVRIVDELRVRIRIAPSRELLLAGPPRACLVGPDPAPDDAGLEDRCWGEGELGELLTVGLPRDAAGRIRLPAGPPLELTVTVARGDARCDYPPGAWRLELRLDPVVDGLAAGPRYAPDATFEIPFDRDAVLDLVEERRYCGLASKVYTEQGEPQVRG